MVYIVKRDKKGGETVAVDGVIELDDDDGGAPRG